jgi:hypothetical protein
MVFSFGRAARMRDLLLFGMGAVVGSVAVQVIVDLAEEAIQWFRFKLYCWRAGLPLFERDRFRPRC